MTGFIVSLTALGHNISITCAEWTNCYSVRQFAHHICFLHSRASIYTPFHSNVRR